MYQRPDASNGESYDPAFRVSVADYEPKPESDRPVWLTERFPDADPNDEPFAFYNKLVAHPTALYNCAPYQSKLKPYLYGLPSDWQGQAWGV